MNQITDNAIVALGAARIADRTEPITITVTINGGLVSDVLLPPGWEDRITVRVENEDTEDANETEIQEDADGRTYTTVLWP